MEVGKSKIHRIKQNTKVVQPFYNYLKDKKNLQECQFPLYEQ